VYHRHQPAGQQQRRKDQAEGAPEDHSRQPAGSGRRRPGAWPAWDGRGGMRGGAVTDPPDAGRAEDVPASRPVGSRGRGPAGGRLEAGFGAGRAAASPSRRGRSSWTTPMAAASEAAAADYTRWLSSP
jgi:hypothetical protein